MFSARAADVFRPLCFFPAAMSCFLSGLGAGQGGELHPFGVGTVERVGVVADHGHARGVLALSVNLHSTQASVMVVHPLPHHAVVGLGHSALHVADDPDAASRDGDVHQKGMNILPLPKRTGWRRIARGECRLCPP